MRLCASVSRLPPGIIMDCRQLRISFPGSRFGRRIVYSIAGSSLRTPTLHSGRCVFIESNFFHKFGVYFAGSTEIVEMAVFFRDR